MRLSAPRVRGTISCTTVSDGQQLHDKASSGTGASGFGVTPKLSQPSHEQNIFGVLRCRCWSSDRSSVRLSVHRRVRGHGEHHQHPRGPRPRHRGGKPRKLPEPCQDHSVQTPPCIRSGIHGGLDVFATSGSWLIIECWLPRLLCACIRLPSCHTLRWSSICLQRAHVTVGMVS